MDSIPRPNKTFVADYTKEYDDESKIHYHIIIAAKNEQTAANYLYEKFRVVSELIWLMNCNYPVITDKKGKELPIQAKILYNTHVWIDKYNQ